MSQQQFLFDLGIILAQVVFWESALFCISVSFFWPWWKQDLGWTIVLKTAAIGLILLPFNLHVWFPGTFPIYSLPWEWVRTVAFASVGVILLWRFIVIYVIQRYSPPPTKSGRQELGDARRRWKARKEALKRDEGSKLQERGGHDNGSFPSG